MKRQLLVNAIITPDGTRLESRHRHDFVGHTDTTNGKFYAVDGGIEYVRLLVDGPFIDACVYSDDPHTKIREEFQWRTFGLHNEYAPNGKLVKVCDMDTDHIKKVIDMLPSHVDNPVANAISVVFYDELDHRKFH